MAKGNFIAGKTVKAASGVAIAAILSGGMYWKMGTLKIPAYEVVRVIDGDTFETKERQLVRLSDVDAPEMGRCGSEAAKKELEKLVLGKPVYIKAVYRDRYMRMISLVYTKDGFVNEKMVEKGLAVYILSGKKTAETEILDRAAAVAIKNKAGVYKEECTQPLNKINPRCVIKGNIRPEKNTKVYSLPGCESYASTLIQLHFGDRWFCTEAEAIKAGFIKAGGCGE